MHRDLKPANVLLNNGICKIADFGFAKTLDFSVTDYNTHMVSIVGTPLYMSP
jgi:serine/threonine protein kinase